jgi:L-seryl-tRNA(Ser) seleniumtransferase
VPVEELRRRAEAIAARLEGLDVRVVDSVSMIGGGGAAGVTLPSAALSLPEPFAVTMRTGSPAVLGRLEAGRCLFDLRSHESAHDVTLAERLRAASGLT